MGTLMFERAWRYWHGYYGDRRGAGEVAVRV